MSTGKPTGADQSTSNGGGGGDPGGGSGQRSTTKLKGGKYPGFVFVNAVKWYTGTNSFFTSAPAGTKIALHSHVCVCVRLQLSRALSYVIPLLCC